MPGIGYVEPNEVASLVTVNSRMPEIGFVDKMYARYYVEPYQVASIVIMNKTYAKNRFICSVNQ